MRLIGRLLNPQNLFTEPPIWAQPDRVFTALNGMKETVGNDFIGYVRDIYKKNGPIFTCILVRMMVFSEIRFAWRDFDESGRPTELFTSPELNLIHRPATNLAGGEMLARMELDASLGGNNFTVRIDETGRRSRFRRLHPSAMVILTGSPTEDPLDYRAEPIAYIYDPKRIGGRASTKETIFTPGQVIHYSPLPDPDAQWRGMSWLTPVIEEIKGDKAATRHKLKFFENGAIPSVVLSYDKSVQVEQIERYMELFEEKHAGSDNAYKALHLGGGVDPKPLGTNFQQLEFKTTQAAGEARIAAASGLGAVMAQFSEGLGGSSLNEGNFKAAKDRSETVLFRPLWRIASASIEPVLVKPSETAQLWFDPRDVAFLRDDAKAEAEVQKIKAEALQHLWNSGWEPETAKKAILSNDFNHLTHTGLKPVQAQQEETE